MSRRLWYIGTPYSRYEAGLDAAARDAAIQAGHLLRAGVDAFSPITHSHPIARHAGIDPLDHGLWMALDEHFMEAAFGLIVCKLDGWWESEGLEFEIQHFKSAGKPVIPMEPGEVPIRAIRAAEEIAETARTHPSRSAAIP